MWVTTMCLCLLFVEIYYGSSYVHPRTYCNNLARRRLNIHIRGNSAFGGDGGKVKRINQPETEEKFEKASYSAQFKNKLLSMLSRVKVSTGFGYPWKKSH